MDKNESFQITRGLWAADLPSLSCSRRRRNKDSAPWSFQFSGPERMKVGEVKDSHSIESRRCGSAVTARPFLMTLCCEET
jgi:hypothetical protein